MCECTYCICIINIHSRDSKVSQKDLAHCTTPRPPPLFLYTTYPNAPALHDSCLLRYLLIMAFHAEVVDAHFVDTKLRGIDFFFEIATKAAQVVAVLLLGKVTVEAAVVDMRFRMKSTHYFKQLANSISTIFYLLFPLGVATAARIKTQIYSIWTNKIDSILIVNWNT